MRDYDDIPEVFRRAFDEFTQRNEGGEDEPPGRPPRPRGTPFWRNRYFWVLVILFLLLLSFNWIIHTYTDWLWFQSMSYEDVWLTQWSYQIVSFLTFFSLALVIMLGNWLVAKRRVLRTGQSPQLFKVPGINWLIIAPAVFLAYVFGQAGTMYWDEFLRFVFRTPFNVAEPIYNLDVSFYLFELPIYEFLQGWIVFLLFLTLVGTAVIYFLGNARMVAGGRLQNFQAVPGLRPHAALLATFIVAGWAVGLWLSRYDLLYSPRGVVFGASYTDLAAERPAIYIQTVLMAVLAVMVAINIFRSSLRPALFVAALWFLATIAIGGVYPSLLQRYSVEPNEISRERPYIEHNIEFTRLAFGLDNVIERPFELGEDLTPANLAEEVSLKNVRVWDYRPLQSTYTQLQGLRPYYQFNEIDIDRYNIDGEDRQVMLAVRELNKDNLPSQTWVNEKLVFTHGYGVVMNPVDSITRDGQPTFFIQDLPPQSTIDLTIDRPELYFGELTNDVVFAGSRQLEFSYPQGESNVSTTYEGSGGILLSNYLRRLAFAFRFAETNLLLSQDITPETRVLMHRSIRERILTITPFLQLDSDPYIVIADGRLVWVADAYTLSGDFPYATRVDNSINYIRNSVKITVDAYDGTVTYYLNDPNDPIIQAYAQAYPGLFQPLDTMPESLRSHLRYPEDLFVYQTRQFLKYHMDNVDVFYNQEDLWDIPTETLEEAEQAVEPYYVILTLPGEAEPEFLLIQPYTPAGKSNMIAWIAARNDGENYGQLVAYELPKQELVFGPSQIEARINQDTEISGQISLWDQQGSRVIRGNLIVIPIANNFLYVEPLYLLSESSALPELKRVIVATGDRIAMEDTLAGALAALLEDDTFVTSGGASTGSSSGDTTGAATGATTGDTGEVAASGRTFDEIIASANAHFVASEEARASGDWATFGAELELLQADLEELATLSGE
ncbi:MAG: UPF0182 family protein [Anaerolineales bacterium]|nr:UPF0182 family protein [Anaerolineales bacterium]